MSTEKRPIVRIHDLETGEIIDREMNDKEFANYTSEITLTAAQLAAEQEAAAKKAAALAALAAAAGLDPDDVAQALGV